MALSIYTNPASMSAINSMARSNAASTKAGIQIATGLKINSAADGAAGLQIASRLDSEINGMKVGLANNANSKSMLQTAEGAFDEMKNIMIRMKELSLQAANGTNSSEDKKALEAEYRELHGELRNTIKNTRFSGEALLDASGSLSTSGGISFQIGGGKSEQLVVNLKDELMKVRDGIGTGNASGGLGAFLLTSSASNSGAIAAVSGLEAAIGTLGVARSKLGANMNRLDHTSNNLRNMVSNTEQARGSIMDTDYASAMTELTRNQMLEQTSSAMLGKANQATSLIQQLVR